MAKQTKITVETDSLMIVRGRNSTRAWCSKCGSEAEMVSIERMGVITNLDRPELEEWLNSDVLHRSHSANGSAQICLNSLLDRVLKTKLNKPPRAE